MHHLDLELLQAALGGDLPVKTLMRHVLAHLGELCPECAETVESLRRAHERDDDTSVAALQAAARERHAEKEGRGGEPVDPRLVGVFDGAFDRAQGEAAAWAIQVRRERRKARADVRELLRAPAEVRVRKIERARGRYRSRAVAELLLEESRRIVRRQPAEARSLAGLVHLVLRWMPAAAGQGWAQELAVRADAWIANTYRVEYDLRAAERKLAEVRTAMARHVVGEAVHAEVASLEASLRVDQGRFEEARQALDRAALLSRADGRGDQLTRILIQRGLLEDLVGRSAVAVAVQREALELLSEQAQPQLYRESLVNLGFFLVNGSREREAAALFAEHEGALRAAAMWDWPHVQSIRGRIAFALADLAEAERLFLAAQAELIGRKDAVRAAVASLDLAVLYLAQGKTAELRRMARLMGTIFDSAELESEALAAVVLFQKAVEGESVTEAAIRAWRRQLELARVRGGRQPQPS
jgi:tetratricopeptide (TPR) repeat protein